MNRLLPELHRLYGLGPTATDTDEAAASGEGAGSGAGSRAAVLAVVLPAGWEQLSSVWRGVQADLELPAPAIAVSGLDALQLWFSFASPIPPAAGARFLQVLRERYLPGVRPSQVRAFAEAAELPVAPCREIGPQRWSAFVTPDLASVFADTPWLDMPPTDEGQASILRALEPMGRVAIEAASDQLCAVESAVVLEPAGGAGQAAAAVARNAGEADTDPGRFLTSVMNDATAPLALRIEAAGILLGCGKRS